MLTRSYNGHVNPVGWLTLSLLQWAFPGSHTALAVSLCSLGGSHSYRRGRLALNSQTRWQGPYADADRWAECLRFETSVWFAASIYALPYQLFLVACLFAFVRA